MSLVFLQNQNHHSFAVILTPESSDVQHVANDLLADVLCRLVPGQLDAAGAEAFGLEAGGGLGQFWSLDDGETSAGLVGASTVFCDALIDGLVLGGNASDGESPVDREGGRGDGGGQGWRHEIQVQLKPDVQPFLSSVQLNCKHLFCH